MYTFKPLKASEGELTPKKAISDMLTGTF